MGCTIQCRSSTEKAGSCSNLGSAGSEEGSFWLPAGIAADEQDRIYVADTYNHRVQVFQFLGEPAENGPAPASVGQAEPANGEKTP